MKIKLKKSIKFKMCLYQIILVVFIILITGIINYIFSINLMIKDVKKLDFELVSVMSKSFDSMAKNFKKQFNFITMNEEIQNCLKQNYISNNTTEFHEVNNKLKSLILDQTIFMDEIHSFYLYDTQNIRVGFKKRYIKGEPEIIYDKLNFDDFSDKGRVTIEERDNFLLFKRQILDLQTNETIGYLVMIYDKINMQQQIDIVNVNNNRIIFLVDENGDIISGEYNIDFKENIDDNIINYVIYNIKSTNSTILNLNNYGKSIITAHKSSETGWYTISISPIESISNSSKIILRMTIFIGVLWVIIASFTVLIYTNKILKPIVNLRNIVEQISINNNLSLRINYNEEDEIGFLSNSFNNLISKIESLINNVYDEEIKRKDAQLMALQSQINPHFLYNTLECINWLAEFGKMDEIKVVTVSFANIMKISAKDKKIVTIAEEIKYTNDFLSIYKITLQGRLQCDIDIQYNILKYNIPKLILQPIVENAVVHGIKNKIGTGIIKINGFIREEYVVLQVIDTGGSFSEDKIFDINSYIENSDFIAQNLGIGIKNIIDRLKIFYHKNFKFTVQSQPTMGTIVEISILESEFK